MTSPSTDLARRYRGVPFAVRLVTAVAGVALLVLPGALHPVPFLITLAGLVGALVAGRAPSASSSSRPGS